MLPIIDIFNFRISSFLLFIGLGFGAGIILAWIRLRKEAVPRYFLFHTTTLILCGAFVGSKTYYVIQEHEEFLSDPIGVFFNLNGTGWFGGFLLCLLLMSIYLRRMHLSSLYFADILIPAVPLGIIFGRIGCFLAGDACYGLPTDLPWGMSFPQGAVPTLLTVHPAQLYEIAANIIILALLIRLGKSKPADGFVLAAYLILSAIARFFVEFIRMSPVALWGLTAPQLISVCLFAAGIFLLLSHFIKLRFTSATSIVSTEMVK